MSDNQQWEKRIFWPNKDDGEKGWGGFGDWAPCTKEEADYIRSADYTGRDEARQSISAKTDSPA